jgi:hypothetical protein
MDDAGQPLRLFYTETELAELLGIPVSTLRYLLPREELVTLAELDGGPLFPATNSPTLLGRFGGIGSGILWVPPDELRIVFDVQERFMIPAPPEDLEELARHLDEQAAWLREQPPEGRATEATT